MSVWNSSHYKSELFQGLLTILLPTQASQGSDVAGEPWMKERGSMEVHIHGADDRKTPEAHTIISSSDIGVSCGNTWNRLHIPADGMVREPTEIVEGEI